MEDKPLWRVPVISTEPIRFIQRKWVVAWESVTPATMLLYCTAANQTDLSLRLRVAGIEMRGDRYTLWATTIPTTAMKVQRKGY